MTRAAACALAVLLCACETPITTMMIECTRSSECTAPLVCIDGTCRSECTTARDCGAGRRCVRTADIGRCLIESLDQCDPEPCELDGLVCRDDRCYNTCELCAPDTVCQDGICVLPTDGG